MSTSDTPRTDAKVNDAHVVADQIGPETEVVNAEFCRQLEQELTVAIKERDEARALVAEGLQHLEKAMEKIDGDARYINRLRHALLDRILRPVMTID